MGEKHGKNTYNPSLFYLIKLQFQNYQVNKKASKQTKQISPL